MILSPRDVSSNFSRDEFPKGTCVHAHAIVHRARRIISRDEDNFNRVTREEGSNESITKISRSYTYIK